MAREILVSAGLEGAKAILVAKADGSAVRTLDVGSLEAIDPIYRAPYGREVIFVGHPLPGSRLDATADGLYAVKPDGSGLRPIVAPTNLLMLGPKSSPDGTQIAYDALRADYEATGSPLLRVFIVAADGGAPRILRDLAGADDLEIGGSLVERRHAAAHLRLLPVRRQASRTARRHVVVTGRTGRS